VTAEDAVAAGAIVTELETIIGRTVSCDDTALIAKEFWAAESVSSERLLSALRQSQGGSNLVDLGFDRDIEFAARVDAIELVAEYFPQAGDVRTVRSSSLPLPYGRT
jgi:2-phosphosulfolactate phosphatase